MGLLKSVQLTVSVASSVCCFVNLTCTKYERKLRNQTANDYHLQFVGCRIRNALKMQICVLIICINP